MYIAMRLYILALLCTYQGMCVFGKERVTIVNFVVGNEANDPFQYRRSGAAVDMALEKIRNMLEDHVTINFVRQVYSAPCSANHIGALTGELYYIHNVTAIIGPACSPAADVVGRMAASWNIAFLSPMATSSFFRDKSDFRSMTRLYYNMHNWAKTYLYFFDMHDWQDIAMIHESNHAFYQVGSSSLAEAFVDAGKTLYKQSIDNAQPYDIEAILRRASERSRVFVLIMRENDVRHTLLTAQRLGMTTGEYVFIFHRAFGGVTPWKRDDQYDKDARQAFDAVVITQPRRPDSPDFVAFEEEVKARSLADYNYTYGERQVSLSVANYHDAFMVYAHALNETLSAGEDYTDANVLNAKIWGRNFKGVSGDIAIDANGDREMDFSLLDLDAATGEFKVVANYFGIIHGIVFEPDSAIDWPGNAEPPSNMPRCGFRGENPACRPPVTSWESVLGIVLAVSCLVFIAATYLIYRKFKLESELHSLWWKARWEDVTPTTAELARSRASTFSSLKSTSSTGGAHMYGNTGIYKGNMVIIKPLNTKHVRIDRTTLLELKQMREIQCANLTRLVGMCSEQPHVCLLTEYCTRGSLRDILHNDAIKLENDFKLSLLNDIIKGVAYIHGSSLTCHGRLNTNNCQIDGRFVLKITDYGLNSIRLQEQPDTEFNEHVFLYVAPEHLRTNPLTEFTKEGDVYSFAIILLELMTRSEPYETELVTNTASDLLGMIKHKFPPLRPRIAEHVMNVHLAMLIEDCWGEAPDTRPTISAVKQRMKEKFPSGSGKNIMDSLLQRMEHYANNLEVLVDERTQAFLEEKRKADELLLEILPRSVATKLKNGETVAPEAYEEVTVYFSDIVGFTNIAAACTPLQVIDLLNDLYTCFDAIIDNFDVYKVETIGDAYMVVSGLPIRNGHEHVRQIALMSLSILENVMTFVIRHMPNTPLRARIGLHTGPVCAGVVGRKMPRYCLFGDTVNTASRMESSGEAMKIHISESTMCFLSEVGDFNMEDRGDIDIKGKGTMKTYWLLGEDR